MKQFLLLARAPLFLLLVGAAVVSGACARTSRGTNSNRGAFKAEAPSHLNINTASAKELEQLPGIGPVIAERIVAYREQYGRFKRREDIMMVEGISEKKYEELRSMIVVE